MNLTVWSKKIQPDQRDCTVLCAAILAGILTHGVMLVNKYSFHDDIYELFAPGQTFIAGRWFLGLVAKAEELLFGTTTLSLPLLNGMLGILLFGAAAVVLVRLYDLRSRSSWILCGCAAVMMPSVVSMMGFMFTVHYYALGYFLAAAGAALLARSRSRREVLAGAAMVILALGIYQATLPFVCAIMVLYFMQNVLQNSYTAAAFLRRAALYLLQVAAAVMVYGVLALAGMRTVGRAAQTTDYAGLSAVGHTGMGTYLARVLLAYKEFLRPTADAIYNQYPARIRAMYLILLVFLFVLVAAHIVRTVRRGCAESAAQYLLLAAILPLCMNLVFVMTDIMWVHAITVYAQMLLFFWLAIEWETMRRDQKAGTAQKTPAAVVSAAALLCAFCMAAGYVRYGNLCYLKAEFLTAEATSYFDRLITRIQSCEGYEPDMPIVYLSEQDKRPDTLYDMAAFDAVITSPYNYDTLINDYAWKEYMKYWNNFDPIVYPENTEGALPEDIKAMPRYPAEGSIKVEEPGYVVVKF